MRRQSVQRGTFWYLALISLQGCAAPHPERHWVTSLVQDYSRSVRPVRSSAHPLVVTVQVLLLDILSLEESSNRMTVRAWISLGWTDAFLFWNPQKHGGVDRLNFATAGSNLKIWTPDVTVINALKMEYGRDTDAVVHWNGTVTWVQPFTVTLPASYEFRGNAWTGTLRISSWTYDASLLQLQPLNPKDIRMHTGVTTVNDHWGVLTNTGHVEETVLPCCRSHVSSISYVLRFRKKIGSSLMGRRSALPLPMNDDVI